MTAIVLAIAPLLRALAPVIGAVFPHLLTEWKRPRAVRVTGGKAASDAFDKDLTDWIDDVSKAP